MTALKNAMDSWSLIKVKERFPEDIERILAESQGESRDIEDIRKDYYTTATAFGWQGLILRHCART